MAGPLQTTLPTNSMEGATSCVNISILRDTVLEGDHSFAVEVTSATPSVVMVGMPSNEQSLSWMMKVCAYRGINNSVSYCVAHMKYIQCRGHTVYIWSLKPKL